MQTCQVPAKIVLLLLQDDVQIGTSAFTYLLMHNSMTFEHMFGRFNSRLYSHNFAYADVLLDTYQQEACLCT